MQLHPDDGFAVDDTPSDAAPAGEPAVADVADIPPEYSEPAPVRARWVDPNPTGVVNPEQGFIRYGDEFVVHPDQLRDDARLIAWSDDWQPDPDVVAALAAYDADKNPEA